VSGEHGRPDLLTLRREKARAPTSFVSCVDRFDNGEMLRRLCLEARRPRTPAHLVSSWPLDTGLPHLVPAWEWDEGVSQARW
jgi:hypothetical protein